MDRKFKQDIIKLGVFMLIAQQFLFVIAATLPARQEKGKL